MLQVHHLSPCSCIVLISFSSWTSALIEDADGIDDAVTYGIDDAVTYGIDDAADAASFLSCMGKKNL